MNDCIHIGRLTRDPEIRYTQGENSICVARFTLAVDRRGKDAGADFLSFKALGEKRRICRKVPEEGNEGGNKIKSPCRFL